MSGYYRIWSAVFALLGYLLGLSVGLDALTAIAMAAGGLIVGLAMAWSNHPRSNHKEFLVAQAVTVGVGIFAIALANLAFGWPWWGTALFAGWAVLILCLLALNWAASPRRDAEARTRRQQHAVAGHEPL